MSKTPIPHIIAMAAGYVAWRAIGGIGGLLVGVLLVVPIVELVFAAIGGAFSSGTKQNQTEQPKNSEAEERKSDGPKAED